MGDICSSPLREWGSGVRSEGSLTGSVGNLTTDRWRPLGYVQSAVGLRLEGEKFAIWTSRASCVAPMYSCDMLVWLLGGGREKWKPSMHCLVSSHVWLNHLDLLRPDWFHGWSWVKPMMRRSYTKIEYTWSGKKGKNGFSKWSFLKGLL